MEQQISLAYPLPPPWYKNYANYPDSNQDDGGHRPVQLDDSLKPPEPISGLYSMFGEGMSTDDRIPSLKELGITELFSASPDQLPSTGVAAELKKLNHSLLLTFIELTETLVKEPAAFAQKLETLRLIFINMHYLINSYRPHQARDTFRLMMEHQIQRRKDMSTKIQTCLDDIDTIFKECKDSIESTINKQEFRNASDEFVPTNMEVDNTKLKDQDWLEKRRKILQVAQSIQNS